MNLDERKEVNMYNPYAELKHAHHVARYLFSLKRWVVSDRGHEIVAVITTSTANHVTELTITLVLGRHRLLLDPTTRPGGMRTALRWVCQELNNGHFHLGTRLALEHKARLLDYSEPELLACEHAYDYQYCLQLLANLPGLSESWPKREGGK